MIGEPSRVDRALDKLKKLDMQRADEASRHTGHLVSQEQVGRRTDIHVHI
jgi:hypothetical protein